MLSAIRVRNFKCFEDHTVTFKPTTVMVGANNSGKSSIIEALHLVSVVIDYFHEDWISFSYPPENSNIEQGHRGFRVPLKNKGFTFETMFYRYAVPPAIIDAFFHTNEVITIYVYKKNWAFVRIKDKIFILGVSDNSITLLDKQDDFTKDLEDEVGSDSGKTNFLDMLKQNMSKR